MDENLKNNLVPSDASDDEVIEVIPDDALIDLTFSTGFYKRVQMGLYFLLEGKDAKAIQSAHDQIKSGDIKDPWVYHYETYLILCKEVEKKAKEQGKLEKTTVGELKKKIEDLDA